VVLPRGHRIEVHPDFDTNTFEQFLPAVAGIALAFGAMTIATRLVRDDVMSQWEH